MTFRLRKVNKGTRVMMDYQTKLQQFETLTADCELIGKLATDGPKRELYLRLALHYRELVANMRKAIATKTVVTACCCRSPIFGPSAAPSAAIPEP